MSDDEIHLWRELIRVAEQRYDGHLTIMKFSTNWRVGFVTPVDRDEIAKLPVGETFIRAAESALKGSGDAHWTQG